MNLNTYRKMITVIILTLMITGESYAAKWKTMTFGDDIAKTLEELNQYCIMHDMKPEDVLWANKTSESELKAGQVIYLPANHADMLSVWQNVGAWQPTALIPVNSKAAAKRAEVQAEKAEKAEKKTEAPAPKAEIKPAEPEIDIASLLAEYEKPKQPAPKVEITPEKKEQEKKVAQVTAVPAVQPEKTKAAPSPANVIKETAKPDKILTAKAKKSQQEIPGLMDPIIIFSPNGDPTHGPM